MATVQARELIQQARRACAAVAEGPFTPVVFERYEYIGGERGWRLGYPSETIGGFGCICWSDRSRWPAIGPVAEAA
jgi:hypothetical protein